MKLRSEDWFGKASAGLVLGFFLALGLSGCVGVFLLDGVSQFSIEHQFTMWIIGPMLICILSGCFFFQTSLRAWGWLGLANAVVWGLLLLTG